MRLLFLFFFIVQLAHGQQDLKLAEQELARLGMKSISAKTEAERLAIADSFATALDLSIGTTESFNFAFEEVKNLSKLISPDKNFRIYSWSVPMKNGSFTFFGRLVLKDENKLKVIRLKDRGDSLDAPEFRQLKATDWYGAIYYDLIKTKHKKKAYYTLLGYRPNKGGYNAKVLEVISSDNLETFRFGERIFNTPTVNGYKYKRKPYRLIFRYNPRIVATVKYFAQRDKIIMDHLAPPDASKMNQWQLYGPDFTFDALFWKKGKWELEEGIEMNNNISPATPQPTEKGLPKK